MKELFEEPTFLVQIGHNGHKLASDNVEKGFADGAILRPADYTKSKNENIADELDQEDGLVFFDPQFYIPRADRDKMETYQYFNAFGGQDFDTSEVQNDEESEELCKELIDLQDEMDVDAYITPARKLDTFSQPKIDFWLDLSEKFIQVAREEGRDIPILASLPVDSTPLVDASERDKLLNEVTKLDVDGFYVSVEFGTEERYPLNGTANVYAYLHLLTMLERNRYEVLVGHTHHIAHLFLGLGINAFATGHYKNLRSFDVRRWAPEDDQGGGKHVVNYYSDPLLNDVRVDQGLDLLYQREDFDLEKIRTNSPYEEDLFENGVPSQVGWKLRDGSWDHYIWACSNIAQQYKNKNIEQRCNLVIEKLENAEALYSEMQERGILLSEPNEEIYDSWRAAFKSIKSRVL